MTLSISEMKPPGRKASDGDDEMKRQTTLQQLHQLQQLTITKVPQFPSFCSPSSSFAKGKKLSTSSTILRTRKTTKQFYSLLTLGSKYFLVQTPLVDGGVYPLNKVYKSFSQRCTKFSVLHVLVNSQIFCTP